MDLHHDDRFNRPAGCFTSPGNENGRIPQCCPGRLLIPSQAGSLAPSYPMFENWRARRVLPPLSPARQAGESAVSLRALNEWNWWGMVVVRHLSLPACLKTAGLQSAGRDIPRCEIVAGAVKHLLEACRPPCIQNMVEPAGYAPASAVCKTTVLLLNEGPFENGTPPPCCPERAGIWTPCCACWRAARVVVRRRMQSSATMVRPAGVAPASPDWHTGILLLNDDRK